MAALTPPKGDLQAMGRRMSILGALLTGSLLILLCGGFVLAQAARATLADALLLAVVVLTWIAAWIVARRRLVPWLITAPFVALLVGVLVLPLGATWPPIASMAFATTVIGICVLPTLAAGGVILVGAVSTYIGTTTASPTTLLISTGFLDNLVPTLVALTLPTAMLGVVHLSREAVTQADALSDASLAAETARRIESGIAETQRAIARRIHDTVLNTLLAIASGGLDRAAARGRARDDLALLQSLAEPPREFVMREPSTPPREQESAETWNELIERPLLRLCFLPTVLLGILLVPIAAQSVPFGALVIPAYALYTLALLALVPTRGRLRSLRVGMALVALALGATTVALAALGAPGCSSAVPMHWIIYSVAGGGLLPVLTLRGTVLRIAALAAFILATFAAALAWPVGCRTDAVDAAFENLVWSGLILGLFIAVQRRFVRAREISLARWEASAAAAVREAALAHADEQLAAAVAPATPLLAGIADGSLDPTDREVRHLARVEEHHLRTHLRAGEWTGLRRRDQVIALSRTAADHGAVIGFDAIGLSARALEEPEVEALHIFCSLPHLERGEVLIDDESVIVIADPDAARTMQAQMWGILEVTVLDETEDAVTVELRAR